MTYLEKLKKEHPTWALLVAKDYSECPEDYGYSSAKELCLYEKVSEDELRSKDICRRCWNQEVKEGNT